MSAAIPTVSDLLTPRTQDEWTAIALASLQGKNFPTTDWTSTSPERAMLETDTACLADQSTQIPLIVQLVLVYYALGNATVSEPAPPSLQFVAYYWYQIPYNPATATIGNVVLSCNSLAGPYTIAVNQLIAVSQTGQQYTNVTGGTLSTSGTLTLSWQALQTGSAGNVGNNTITTLITPLPGVTINNPGTALSAVTHTGSGTGTVTPSGTPLASHNWIVLINTSGIAGTCTWSYSTNGGGSFSAPVNTNPLTPGGSGVTITLAGTFNAGDRYAFSAPGGWITTTGNDIETAQHLARRCLDRWPALGAVPVADKYELWAFEADSNVGRVAIFTDPATAATVAIYIAGQNSILPASDVNQVQAYIDVRAGLTDLPVVYPVSTQTVTLTGTATYPAGQPDIVTDRNNAIAAYVNGAPIGGTGGNSTVIEIAQIIALALNLNSLGIPQGATNITGVELGGFAVDMTITNTEIPALVNNLAWTPV